MRHFILSILSALLLSSCAVEHARNGDNVYTSARVGTDTAYRSVNNGAFASVTHGENNSASFRETTSLGKYITVAKTVDNIATNATKAWTTNHSTSEATTRALATEQTTRHAATTAADVTKAGMEMAPEVVPIVPLVPFQP